MNSRQAMDRMRSGECVRRPHWPDGQYLKWRPETGTEYGKGDVAVFRNHALSGLHHNPSADELDADDYEVYPLPAGVSEINHGDYIPLAH